MKKTRFQRLLEEAGLTVAEAARKCGLPYMTVKNHADGKRIPKAETVILYERCLGIARWKIRPELWEEQK